MSIYYSFVFLLALNLSLLSAACGGSNARPAAPVYERGGRAKVQLHSEAKAQPQSAHTDASADSGAAAPDYGRPGLGTRFGERRESMVSRSRFVRMSSAPFAKIALHYNNWAGIQRQIWSRGSHPQELRAQTSYGGISVSLIDESGRVLRGDSGGGRYYVVGQAGQRYAMQIRNDTGGRYEMVSSVDGLDVVDGKLASFGKRGYILAPYSTLVVEGFRTSEHDVAAFRFGSVSESYAARTSGARNVGVIGFAFFSERGSQWRSDETHRRETANPFPGGFAAPPR